MFVLVIGGGRVGSQLTTNLLEGGYEVRLVENRPQVLDKLHREVPTEIIVVGDPTRSSVLESAGIQEVQVVAAVHSLDSYNLIIANLARFLYNVPRVIARVNNPRHAWLFNAEMGVDVVLNQAEIISSLIQEEMSLGDMMTLLKLRRGEYALVEEKIPQGAQAVGVPIMELKLPQNCVIAGIIRRGELVVPRGQTTFEIGDEVLAVTDPEGAAQLSKLFARH